MTLSHYIEFQTRRADARDFLYGLLHKALSKARVSSVGVSFPNMSEHSLGSTLRVHGRKEDLTALLTLAEVEVFKTRPILEVPPRLKGFIVYRRVNQTSPRARQKRALARGHVRESFHEPRVLPTAVLLSGSTGFRFPLKICAHPYTEQPQEARFNAYGLGSPVPVF